MRQDSRCNEGADPVRGADECGECDPDHTAEGCARKFSEVRPLFASDRDPGDEDDAQRWLLSPRWAADRLNYEHDLDSVSSGHVTRRSR